jgi:hypothetical protein
LVFAEVGRIVGEERRERRRVWMGVEKVYKRFPD